jgi:nucleotide-binding universal stress UspA family protein
VDHPLTLLSEATQEQQEDWEHVGFEHIARGRVATVLLATATVDSHPGEEASKAAAAGTARGHGVPRVAVAVEGLPSGKSILQLAAERILRLQQLAAQETFGLNSPVTRLIQW